MNSDTNTTPIEDKKPRGKNYASELATVFAQSQDDLARRVCAYLGLEHRAEEVVAACVRTNFRVKNRKDKDAPKGAHSAYILFTTDMRKKDPRFSTVSQQEAMRELGNMWKALSLEDKEPYFSAARADKERFLEEREAYRNGRNSHVASAAMESEHSDEDALPPPAPQTTDESATAAAAAAVASAAPRASRGGKKSREKATTVEAAGATGAGDTAPAAAGAKKGRAPKAAKA